MALAGKALLLKAGTSVTPTDAVDGVRTCVFNRGRDLIDITTFATSGSTDYRSKLAGLQDGTIDMGGTYLPSDTGQQHFETLFGTGAACYLQMLYDGTNGDEVVTIVENFNIDGDVTRDVQFSTSLSRNGTITAVP